MAESGESITYRSKPAFGAIILEAVAAAPLLLTGAALAPSLISGTMAKHSVFSRASTCLPVRNTRSEISRNIANPRPSTKPPMVAAARMRKDLGELFANGREARVMTRASVLGSDCSCAESM